MLHLRHLGSTLFHLLVLIIIQLFLLEKLLTPQLAVTAAISVPRVLCVFARTLFRVTFMVCSARQRNEEKEGM